MEEEGAGGDEAQLDAAGLLLGDNLVSHLRSHFPTGSADGAADAPAARAEPSRGAQPAPADAEGELPQVDFKRRRLGAGKAANRRRLGASAEDG